MVELLWLRHGAGLFGLPSMSAPGYKVLLFPGLNMDTSMWGQVQEWRVTPFSSCSGIVLNSREYLGKSEWHQRVNSHSWIRDGACV